MKRGAATLWKSRKNIFTVVCQGLFSNKEMWFAQFNFLVEKKDNLFTVDG